MKIETILSILKVVICILFFGCLFKMPYNYYQMTRIVAMITFFLLAYNEYVNKRNYWAIIWLISAIVINPVFKVSLNKKSWNILDVMWIFLIIVNFLELMYKNKKDGQLKT